MAPWPPISRDDLKVAAGQAGFDTTFPLLIRRLIAETADGLSGLDMPGGSGTAAGGFDGVATAARQTIEVPAGTSVWELSVTSKAGTKADEDYVKRLTGPDGGSTAQVTYVEAILAPWTNARKWATQRTKERRWKQVRAYNIDQIDGWLDRAPATTAWLAGQLGKAMPGVRSADTWFEQVWLPSTRIPLTAEYVLAGRDAEAAKLLSALSSGQQVVAISGELTAEEFQAFVAAAISQADSPVREVLAAKTLFVSDLTSLSQLIAQQQPLVLVLPDAVLVAELPAQHHHQVVLLVPPGTQGDVLVAPVNAQLVAGLLKAAGEAWERADDLGALARRSLSGLRRALALNPASLTPGWAHGPDVVRRRLLLIGGWNGTSEGDREIIEHCVGRSYTEVEDVALALAATSDTPMLGRVDEQWHLLAADDAWMLLNAQLTRDDIEALRVAAVKVMSEPDPFFGMDMTGRLAKQMSGTGHRYSRALRQGLARTLALLGSTETAVPSTASTTGTDLARMPVRDVLAAANADSTYQLWTSLGDVLGLLAEAAPEEFLTAMQDGLKGPEPLHTRMFTDSKEEDGLFGGTATHSEFLWALEALAWSPDYFDDAVDVLARLAALDPGGRYSNRPSRSLAEIFSCWHPNTVAGDEQRDTALRRLLRTEPAVARRLLLDLVPDGYDMQIAHRAPRFRDWKREPAITRADIARNANAVIDLLLGDLAEEPDRYLAVISKIDYVSPEHRQVFNERLGALGDGLNDDAARARLSNALRDKIAHHREYADTAWALPADELEALEKAAQAVLPRTALLRSAWLFKSDWVTLGDLSRRDDFEAYEAAMRQRRAEALTEVIGEGGLDAVAELAASSDYPHLVGVALAMQTDTHDREMLSWLSETAPRPAVAYAYLVRRLNDRGPDLLDQFLAGTHDPAVQATILRTANDPPAAWARLTHMPTEVGEAYWKQFVYFGLGHNFGDVLEAAQGLLGARRYAAVLQLLSLYANKANSPEAAEVAAAACEGILVAEEADPELRSLSRHDYEQVFALLDRFRGTVGPQRIINIEWQFFPALGFRPNAPALHTALGTSPEFFAEIIGYVYRSDHTDDEADIEEPPGIAAEATDAIGHRREMSSRAFEVLRSWRSSPGIGPEGVVDLDVLRDWVNEARRLVGEAGRRAMGDHEIGRVLAFAPADPDGTAPPQAVRALLEELRNDDIEDGLQLDIINKRGLTSRGMHDGGDQERQLADTFRTDAAESTAWPRTRKLLRNLADGYDREARQADERAERRRRGLD